jgi:mono/diheme cytochrome c family protein
MHGHGTWSEPRATPPEVVNNLPDVVTPLLPALQEYQLSLNAPPPPSGTVDAAAAERGRIVFNGQGNCASCHLGPLYSDGNQRLHAPSEVVSEPEPNGGPSFASRSVTKQYRTTPLRGLWQHPPYFHNGVAATLDAVVELYNTKKGLGLTAQQKADLVAYLKTL